MLNRLISTLAIVVAVVSSAAIFQQVRRSSRSSVQAVVQIDSVPNTGQLGNGHLRDGPAETPVTIVVFTDLQCPGCRRTAEVLQRIRRRYEKEVAVVTHHFPLQGHPMARPAAAAVECASNVHRGLQYLKLVYLHQDSLSRPTLMRLAEAVGIGDLTSFEQCLTNPMIAARIDKDLRDAADFDVLATPTLLINHWRLVGVPSEQLLDSLVLAQLRRR